MGPGQKFLTQVGSIFCSSGWVSHLEFGFEFGNFLQKMSKNFQFFSLRFKKISSGQGVSLFFTAGQKLPGSASYLLRVKSKLG